jgi:hypothetical protein
LAGVALFTDAEHPGSKLKNAARLAQTQTSARLPRREITFFRAVCWSLTLRIKKTHQGVSQSQYHLMNDLHHEKE